MVRGGGKIPSVEPVLCGAYGFWRSRTVLPRSRAAGFERQQGCRSPGGCAAEGGLVGLRAARFVAWKLPCGPAGWAA